MADHDIGVRIAKLLRLASPKSGSTEPERASAALEAAKLFGDHDLLIIPAPPPKPKRFRRDQPPPSSYQQQQQHHQARHGIVVEPVFRGPHSRSDWRSVIVPSIPGIDLTVHCAACDGIIEPGEEAWFSNLHGRYRHANITCDEDR